MEQHHRDAILLIERGHLSLPARPQLGSVADQDQARDLAGRVRDWLSVGDTPLGPLAEVGERLTQLLLVVDIDADGASVQDDTFGVAVVGGRAEPGRRRVTAAHEVGHHLLGDESSSDVGIAASRDDREQLVEAFAAELLLPRSAVEREVEGRSGDALRVRLIEVAGRWRTSWSLAVSTASAVLSLPGDERRRLLSTDPTRAEFISVLGESPLPDLGVGETGPAWRRAVLAAFGAGDISGARAVELLHGLVTEDDLPDRTALADFW